MDGVGQAGPTLEDGWRSELAGRAGGWLDLVVGWGGRGSIDPSAEEDQTPANPCACSEAPGA